MFNFWDRSFPEFYERKEARSGGAALFLCRNGGQGPKRRIMERRSRSALIITLLFLAVMVSACGKSEFGVTESTDKRITITANNAGKDSYFEVGTLEVGEGEKITAAADLSKGEVRVEIFLETGEQSMDQMPQMEEDPTLWGDLRDKESVSATVGEGSYIVRATCLQKATGTVVIEVLPAE